jgi:arsenate reductase
MKKILFICVENACRSQMAEGIFNHLAKGKHKAFSAGTSVAKDVNHLVIEVMKEIGIDILKNTPKVLTPEMTKNMDRSISMGCINGCPLVKIDEDWAIEDPKDKGIEKMREARKIIYQKVKDLIQRLER